MVSSPVPFNISLLNLTPEKLFGLSPITSLDKFDGATRNFHENGLFSVSIFGRIGEERRNRRYAFVDIKINIFHPVIFRILGQLKRFYIDIISGKGYATWDEEVGDFIRSNPIDGETGFEFFVSHWENIKFEDRPSDIREQFIKLISKYKKISLTNKIIVMPAGLRELEISGDGRFSENEINVLYRKLLSLSNSIPSTAIKNNPEILNSVRYSLQITFNEIYDLLEKMIEGKKKLMMGKWASRRIFNGTRNVITSMNMVNNTLGDPGNINCNNTVIGLYQFLKGSLPVSKFHIKTGFLSKVFTGPNNPVTLINKKTLRSEVVNLSPKYYDAWMTEEGLEKVITAFGEESVRHKELEIEGYYVGLVYKGPGNILKVFQGLDELPTTFEAKYVKPITFCELLYLSVYHFANTLPVYVTRFPITGFGSIYPSMVYLKPTVKSEKRIVLNDNWEVDESIPIAYQFPTDSDFVNSMSPFPTKLSLMGADFNM